MVINSAQETFTGRYSFTWFSLQWKFYWAGAWVHEYTKFCTVSLCHVNSLTCIAYFFSGEGGPQTLPPRDGTPITVAVKCYEDNCRVLS